MEARDRVAASPVALEGVDTYIPERLGYVGRGADSDRGAIHEADGNRFSERRVGPHVLGEALEPTSLRRH